MRRWLTALGLVLAVPTSVAAAPYVSCNTGSPHVGNGWSTTCQTSYAATLAACVSDPDCEVASDLNADGDISDELQDALNDAIWPGGAADHGLKSLVKVEITPGDYKISRPVVVCEDQVAIPTGTTAPDCDAADSASFPELVLGTTFGATTLRVDYPGTATHYNGLVLGDGWADGIASDTDLIKVTMQGTPLIRLMDAPTLTTENGIGVWANGLRNSTISLKCSGGTLVSLCLLGTGISTTWNLNNTGNSSGWALTGRQTSSTVTGVMGGTVEVGTDAYRNGAGAVSAAIAGCDYNGVAYSCQGLTLNAYNGVDTYAIKAFEADSLTINGAWNASNVLDPTHPAIWFDFEHDAGTHVHSSATINASVSCATTHNSCVRVTHPDLPVTGNTGTTIGTAFTLTLNGTISRSGDSRYSVSSGTTSPNVGGVSLFGPSLSVASFGAGFMYIDPHLNALTNPLRRSAAQRVINTHSWSGKRTGRFTLASGDTTTTANLSGGWAGSPSLGSGLCVRADGSALATCGSAPTRLYTASSKVWLSRLRVTLGGAMTTTNGCAVRVWRNGSPMQANNESGLEQPSVGNHIAIGSTGLLTPTSGTVAAWGAGIPAPFSADGAGDTGSLNINEALAVGDYIEVRVEDAESVNTCTTSNRCAVVAACASVTGCSCASIPAGTTFSLDTFTIPGEVTN